MTFNDEIYEAVCNIFPATSVRTFSKALGKSEGYWSSIKAQNLNLSVGALIHLMNTLEAQIIITQHASMKKKMIEVQRKIANELVQRFVEQVEADEVVMEELKKLAYKDDQSGFSSSLPIPIFICR